MDHMLVKYHSIDLKVSTQVEEQEKRERLFFGTCGGSSPLTTGTIGCHGRLTTLYKENKGERRKEGNRFFLFCFFFIYSSILMSLWSSVSYRYLLISDHTETSLKEKRVV